MDIKIKKDEHQTEDRKLDIPSFKSSNEINKEFDQVEFKEHNVSPKDTVKLEKHEDELELTTQHITTELQPADFDTIEVDTIDLEKDIQEIEEEYTNPEKRDEDTIKINQPEFIDLDDEDEQTDIPHEFQVNLKYVYIGLGILILVILLFVSYKTYMHMTSETRFIEQALENQQSISDINVFGESINVISDEKISSFDMYNTESKEITSKKVDSKIDQQLHVSDVTPGNYILFTDDKLITSNTDLDVEFQTITRDDINKNVKITTDDDNIVNIDISKATNQKIDILIDASQGDVQGFTASDDKTTEQELSLKYALALKSNLQEMGYNVMLTREDDSVPGDCVYNDTYCLEGRVAMAYIDNPKIYIQLGFNGEGGSGFEIVDSNLTSHTLARIIKSSLSSSLTPSSRVTDQVESGLYNKTYEDDEGNVIDYLYSIRETGGAIMNSDNTNEEAITLNSNKVGAESIAIDLGYMSESDDFEKMNDSSEIDTISKALAKGIDQYINKY